MDLSILIVTFNSARLIGRLLAHLQAELQSLKAQVIVVNASRDGTADLIAREHAWVELHRSPTNLGFAAGNNLAARHARGRYLLLLNPDAMPHAGAMAQALKRLATHGDLGLAGGELRAEDGRRQPSARMFPTLRDELFTLSGLAARFPGSRRLARLDRRWADPDADALVDWIPGAFVFIPAAVFQALSGFDERFFLYYEEVDLCRRMRQQGLKVHYWPDLKATHIGGASARTVGGERISSGGSQLESWRMRSGLLYYRKHHGRHGACGLHCIEWGWHKLRQVKAVLGGHKEKAAELSLHCRQLRQAWRDTRAGCTSPARPW